MFRSHLADAAVVGCLTATACFCALCARADEPYAIVAQSSRSSATTGRRPLADRIASANLPIISDSLAGEEVGRQRGHEVRSTPPTTGPSEPESAAGRRVVASGSGSGRPTPPARSSQVARRAETGQAAENMAVAAVPVEHLEQHAQQMPVEKPATTTGVWPFSGKWPSMPWTGAVKTAPQQPGGTHHAAAPLSAAHATTEATLRPQATAGGRTPSSSPTARPTSAPRQASTSGAAQRTAKSSGNGLSNSSPASVTR